MKAASSGCLARSTSCLLRYILWYGLKITLEGLIVTVSLVRLPTKPMLSHWTPKGINVMTDMLVFDDKVAMISFDNLIGVIIEDKSIAQTQKVMIKHIWSVAKKLK